MIINKKGEISAAIQGILAHWPTDIRVNKLKLFCCLCASLRKECCSVYLAHLTYTADSIGFTKCTGIETQVLNLQLLQAGHMKMSKPSVPNFSLICISITDHVCWLLHAQQVILINLLCCLDLLPIRIINPATFALKKNFIPIICHLIHT